MKKLTFLLVIILTLLFPISTFARVSSHVHIRSRSHSSSHSSTTSKSTSKSTIKSAKSYTAPKKFTSKYNSSNIKTSKVQEAHNYSSYSTTNMFRPNFWTAMWAFRCMNNNSHEATEQDIAKELEERGYTEQEVQDILKEGKEAEQAENQEQNETFLGIIITVTVLIVILIITVVIFTIFEKRSR